MQTTRPRSAVSQGPTNHNARFVIHPRFQSGDVVGQQQTPGKTLEEWTLLQAHHDQPEREENKKTNLFGLIDFLLHAKGNRYLKNSLIGWLPSVSSPLKEMTGVFLKQKLGLTAASRAPCRRSHLFTQMWSSSCGWALFCLYRRSRPSSVTCTPGRTPSSENRSTDPRAPLASFPGINSPLHPSAA